MPSTYAHNAIGGETEKAKGTVKEKAGKTSDRREKIEGTSDRRERTTKTTDRQVKERARLEMFLTVSPLPSRLMIQLVAYRS